LKYICLLLILLTYAGGASASPYASHRLTVESPDQPGQRDIEIRRASLIKVEQIPYDGGADTSEIHFTVAVRENLGDSTYGIEVIDSRQPYRGQRPMSDRVGYEPSGYFLYRVVVPADSNFDGAFYAKVKMKDPSNPNQIRIGYSNEGTPHKFFHFSTNGQCATIWEP
jgi:hypothetical protein